ncbi:uncharacterized protein LOC103861744 [Brassica rapa]|uniref:uncharacterized protein LOC103861744 n=1 Tax=Brassica campestris TaxID=3711 RepID=UPI000872C2B9|nr:uncharacterized protein LOC103861744 [Brassica rapa]
MSSAVDKALMAMSLEDDDDVPFVMPNLPEYCSTERNRRSLIGRFLNPDCQKMSEFIFQMPRKWQKQGRVRGIALSQERFQFIFDNEHDLVEVLEKGVHTFNERAIVVERWSEKPPPDSLQYMPIWAQIRNTPINYQTELAIGALGDIVGKVIEVAFDPSKARSNVYERVKVRFDVSRPLRKEKVIDLPEGEKTKVLFNYERVQKRCYTCQRLTHDQSVCPINIHRRQIEAMTRRDGGSVVKKKVNLVLSESDPLFGVLEENQVGINPNTGRPRIALEVLDGMRQYLLMAKGEDRLIREERVKSSVREVEKDPVLMKYALSLEPVPMVTKDLEKGKGVVFGYEPEGVSNSMNVPQVQGEKLMASAIRANPLVGWRPEYSHRHENPVDIPQSSNSSSSLSGFTGARLKSFDLNLSGTSLKKMSVRKRPGKNKRNTKAIAGQEDNIQIAFKEGALIGNVEKRKAVDQMGGVPKAVKQITHEAVPKEGLSKDF